MAYIAMATVGVGLYSGYQANKAGDKAAGAQDRATAATVRNQEDQLDFAKEQYDEQLARYDDWMAIYGPIEENLGEFYNNLTPETYAAAGLEYNQQEFQKQKTTALEKVAQRGLATSGILAAVDTQMAIGKAKADATTRRDAPFKVASEKSQFLSAGKGNAFSPPKSGEGTVLANSGVPGAYQAEANRASASASAMWGSAGNMLSTGLNYFAKNYTPSANQGRVKTDYNPTNTPYMPAFGGAGR